MRISALIIRLVVFGIAGVGAYAAARETVAFVEERSVASVEKKLADEDLKWASVLSDGLQVILEGTAPSEAMRFRAISAASEMVDASRVIANMSVIDSVQIAPPEFAIEILRNDSGVSLIGLIPASTDRDALAERITRLANGAPVTDLLEVGDYPAPNTWRDAVNYSVRALELLPRSKISTAADRIVVSAISDSPAEKRLLETALARNTPQGVGLTVNISAPRPVIAPFTTRFILDENGAHFDACAADTDAAIDAMTRAAQQAGFTGEANCTLALGAPSRTWGDAAALAITAVGDMGGGNVTIADTDITLVAPIGTPQQLFDNTVGTLENALPDVFALSADLPVAPETTRQETIEFTATRSPEGQVQLRGRLPDELTNNVAKNFANAKFGQHDVTMGTRVTDGLPSGWSERVLAAIETLSKLSHGSVIVAPDAIEIRGSTGSPDATGEISRLLIDKLGRGTAFDIDVTYVEQLDPVLALPTPEECIAQITTVTNNRKITFDPSSADITAATQPVVDDIAEILKICGDLPILVAGFTDSQGREEMNQQLSQNRAEAVLTALRGRRVPVSTFDAVGFGEADPIADNETEEGREANRRIEFSLIRPTSTAQETTTLDELAAPAAPANDAGPASGIASGTTDAPPEDATQDDAETPTDPTSDDTPEQTTPAEDATADDTTARE